MNIFVCLKQVPDTASQIKIMEDGKGIDESSLEWIINPYDEFALEEALQIKEKHNGKVSVFSLGPVRAESTLRRALAMGADQAHLIECSASTDPFFASAALAQAIKSVSPKPNLILMGKVGVDENHNATGPMLAERLEVNHIGFVNQPTQITQQENGGYIITVKRLMNGMVEEICTSLPLLLTIDKGIGQPRYPSLPGIIQAKKKPLQKITLDSAESLPRHICFHSYKLPDKTPSANIISGSPEEQTKQLVHLLKTKEKVL